MQEWHHQQAIVTLMQKTKESSGTVERKAGRRGMIWMMGSFCQLFGWKNLFKLVEKKAQYLGLNTSEALCTKKWLLWKQ